MKKVILFILLFWSVVFYFSCTNGNAQSSKRNEKQISESVTLLKDKMVANKDATTLTKTLFADRTINTGSVSVTNDSYFIYVTYKAQKGFVLTKTHLYIGAKNLLPIATEANSISEKFPYMSVHKNELSYTYQIPILAIPAGSCGSIAAQAEVVKYNAHGKMIDKQTAWGNGMAVNSTNNEEMQFDYCSISQ